MLFDPIYYQKPTLNVPDIPAYDLPKIKDVTQFLSTPKSLDTVKTTPLQDLVKTKDLSSEDLIKPYNSKSSYMAYTYSPTEAKSYKSPNILYSPFEDMEDIYAKQQGTGERLLNAWKGFDQIRSEQTFLGLKTLYSAITEGDISKLWDNEYAKDLATTMENINIENPIYATKEERENGLNFSTWMLRNSTQAGFTVGTISDILVTDVAITLAGMALGFEGGGPIGSAAGGVAATGAGLVRTGNRLFQLVKDFSKLASTGTKLKDAVSIARLSGDAASYIRATATAANLGKASKFLIRGALASSGEAALERETYFREAEQNYINDFRAMHGYTPSEEQLNLIRKQIAVGANWVYGENLALLTASNMIQFPSLLKGSIGNTFIKNVPILFKKEAGKVLAAGLNKRAFLLASGKDFITSMATEGLEEWSQDMFKESTSKYYRDLYSGRKELASKVDAAYDTILENLSEKGLDIFLSGAVIGGLFGGIGMVTDYTGVRIPFTKGTRFEKYGTIKSSARSIAKQYSEILNKSGELFNSSVRQLNIDTRMNNAVNNQDIFSFNNSLHESIHNYVTTSLRTGTYDSRLDEIKDLHGLSLDEFAKLTTGKTTQELEQDGITLTEESKTSYINKLVRQAENIKGLYKSVQTAYGVNPHAKETITKLKDAGFTEEQAKAITLNAWEDFKYTISLNLSLSENLSDRISSMETTLLSIVTPSMLDVLIQPNIKQAYSKHLLSELETVKDSILPSDKKRGIEIMNEMKATVDMNEAELFEYLTESLTDDQRFMVNDLTKAKFVRDRIMDNYRPETIYNQKKAFDLFIDNFLLLSSREITVKPNPDNADESVVSNGVTQQIVPNDQVANVIAAMEDEENIEYSENELTFAEEQNLSEKEKVAINRLVKNKILSIEC